MANQRNQSTQQRAGNGEDFTPMPPQESGSEVLDRAKQTANTLMDHAKTTAGEAYDRVADRTVSSIEEQKAGMSGGLRTFAGSVRNMGNELGQTGDNSPITKYSSQYAQTAANKLEQVADYFNNRDLRAIGRDVENYARRNPAVFVGAAFALGLVAARFLKSTPRGRSVIDHTFSTDVDHQLPKAEGTPLRSSSKPGNVI